ncbi:pyridoxal-phosphate dependent enzyme [Pelagicoccus sp. SDUM812002]|uniref:pyridoxal-phosphate dependent enzyme n=1 Tax=Pelagicoccus sp. SDUM812002 TaxID=3041266 RepID=UPI00280E0CEB|nr:pyridoxal-phosphate dependent enzyme [Pelagicoccus sp. SDUM812002]MDQ8185126.1 pyridoxal-phosphate dependent enzyme [Pelagicoccus sp. SDUM812002]
MTPFTLEHKVDPNLSRPTRIHRVPSIEAEKLWIKREDELSSGISGSKLRKYSSLIPHLIKERVETVGMIGGPNSNNLVGLAQILRENGIKPIAFVRQAADKQIRGNALLLDMLLDKSELILIPREQWSQVGDTAREYLEKQNTRSHLLEEGCSGFEALPGAMSLAKDILRNEMEIEQVFSRIYIDSGTGMSATGLILGLESMAPPTPREIVVTLIADCEERFNAQLSRFRSQLSEKIKRVIEPQVELRFLSPILCPKFGSINASVIQECRRVAKTLGLVMDPTYSAKHYMTAKADLLSNPNSNRSLFIFNGSALGLMGFQDRLSSRA